MKNLLARLSRAAALGGLFLSIQPVLAQGTAFTYQGQLNDGGSPANGLYDFQFSLSNLPSGGSQVGSTIPALALGVTNGLFATNLDFGAVFTGNPTWLAISVRSNGVGSYMPLTPLQELTPAPYAIFANTASNLSGSLPAAQIIGPLLLAQLPPTVSLLSDPGSGNFFAGQNAGNPALSGAGNTGVGFETLPFISTGQFNSAQGYYALLDNGVGSFNTANGAFALEYNTTGSNNTGTGAYALSAYNVPLYVTGGGNTADGAYALAGNESGYNNTGVGFQALQNNTNGFDNVAVGVDALQLLNSGSANFFNTAVGAYTMQTMTSGYYNTGLGAYSLYSLTNGDFNLALGLDAGYYLLNGGNNIYIGNYGAATDNNVTRIGQGQTATYISSWNGSFDNGVLSLEQNDTNNGLVYAATGLIAVPGGAGAFLYGFNGGALGTVVPNAINLSWDYSGDVWVSNNLSTSSLTVRGNFAQITGANAFNGAGPIDAYIGGNGSGSDVQIGSMNSSISNVAFYNWGNSTYMHIFCSAITIEGGADLAEPFAVSSPSGEIPQGSVMVIDDENPGRLKVSSRPYDTRVAGVLSGANGVHPGIQMQQQGLIEGGKNVALTGRVYVQADTSNGPIKPGDLLTTSATPGHAMKVTDHARASGAILGKAMTGLSEGRGLVLVLVTLQ